MDEIQKAAKVAKAEEKARKKALRPWYSKKRFIIPIALAALVVFSTAMNGGSSTESTVSSNQSASSNNDSETQAVDGSTTPTQEPDYGDETTGQRNARGSAESYLRFQAFSMLGLIDQLEYEGYTLEDCEYAVNILDVDWKEQALLKAESYLEYQAFSQEGLFEQLQYEKFTDEEASYGVLNVTVDWMEQAALKAKSYLEYQTFSKDGLIDQLLFEGFTKEQAEYGVSQNGY